MQENEMNSKALVAFNTANELSVRTEDDLRVASELMKGFKNAKHAVTEFFKPLKEKAYEAHKAIVEREKNILKPFEDADRLVKSKVNEFNAEMERIRREKEAELRRLQEAERERLLAQAANDNNEVLLDHAVAMDSFTPVVQSSIPKVEGMATRTNYVVRIVDETKVPVFLNGIVIRPIDLAAIKKIAQLSKGQQRIEGVEIDIIKESYSRG